MMPPWSGEGTSRCGWRRKPWRHGMLRRPAGAAVNRSIPIWRSRRGWRFDWSSISRFARPRVLLVQKGKLCFDDPVSKYVEGVPNGDKITISDLLKMRSALYTEINLPWHYHFRSKQDRP